MDPFAVNTLGLWACRPQLPGARMSRPPAFPLTLTLSRQGRGDVFASPLRKKLPLPFLGEAGLAFGQAR